MVDYAHISQLDQEEVALRTSIHTIQSLSERTSDPGERKTLTDSLAILKGRLEEVIAQTSIADA